MDNNRNDTKKFVEEYHKGILEAEQKKQFENKIISDPVFAEEVAFYLSTIIASKELQQEDATQRFRGIYKQQADVRKIERWNVRNLYKLTAAVAALIIISLGSYFFLFKSENTEQLATAYISTHLLVLSQKMGAADTMQTGIQYYNKQAYDSALYFFESINKNNTDYSEARKNAGLTYLKEKKYEAALMQFNELINTNSGYNGQAIFLKAVTLMARNKADDKHQAKVLLQQIAQQKTEGYEQAKEWLKKF